MKSFTNLYYLKADTNVSDIYDCIRNMFCNYDFPQSAPRNYSIETDTNCIIWNCPSEDNKLLEFYYSETQKELQIIFSKDVKNNLHRIFYKEQTDTSSFDYANQFMPLLKKFIPKAYIKIQPLDDKLCLQKAFHEHLQNVKKTNSENPDEDIDKAVKDFLLNLIYPAFGVSVDVSTLQNDDGKITFSTSVRKSDARIVIDKSKAAFVNSPFLVTIEFIADVDGKFLIPKSEIEQLSKDLWFINANFILSNNASAILDDKIFMKEIPNWRENYKLSKKNKILEKNFEDYRYNFINGIRNDIAKNFFLDNPSIKLKIGSLEHEIVKSETIMESWSGRIRKESYEYSYEDIKNRILDYITSDENVFYEWINKEFPEFSEKKREDNQLIQEKISFYLKKYEQKEGSFIELSQKHELLEKQIRYLEARNKELQSQNEKLNASLFEIRQKGLTDTISSLEENKYQSLLQKITVLENGNKTLRAENINLKSRLEILEFKKSDEKEDKTIILSVPCAEGDLSQNEIRDYLYKLLYSKIEDEKRKLPKNKEDEVCRKRDVLKSLEQEKEFDWNNSETAKKLERIGCILRKNKKSLFDELKQEGFNQVKGSKNHPKFYYCNEKYQISFSLTPSDVNAFGSRMKEIKARLFCI